jgi:RNA polymerase sigma-70 factor (ECF subfamily)
MAVHGDPQRGARHRALGIAHEAAHGVRAALDELPAEQKTVITYAYFGSMTLAQIAQRTGAPLGTIKRRAQLGLSRLARAMGSQSP